MFFKQLQKLCIENSTTPTAATIEVGLSKGTMSNWKKGATPNGDVVVRFAKHFNVTTDFFLLGTVEKNTAFGQITFDEQELINGYRKLDSRGQHKVHTVIYEELDRINEREDSPRLIPFAASGEADITTEDFYSFQETLQQFDKKAKELEGR